jgi:hypothetical protein
MGIIGRPLTPSEVEALQLRLARGANALGRLARGQSLQRRIVFLQERQEADAGRNRLPVPQYLSLGTAEIAL